MDEREYQAQLAALREEINQVDGELLPLFLRRMDCAQRVAQLKKAAGAPVFNPGREREILDRAGEQGGPEAQALFSFLMSVSRERQHRVLEDGGALRQLIAQAQRSMPQGPVICQGVEGAYSHQAARDLFGEEAQISFAREWEQVFDAVENGEAAYGVLPVENSAAGSVAGVYDLILSRRFFIVGAKVLRVSHCVAVRDPEAPLSRVVSHPQALAQCGRWIAAKGLAAQPFSNTAAAARYVRDEAPAGTGSICSREAAQRYGLHILESDVQDDRHNRTRFIVISRSLILAPGADRISLCFALPHVPGALYGVLQRLALVGVNVTKIESRPIPGSSFEYDFYLDFTGSVDDPQTLAALCAMYEELPRFSFLGNYPEAGESDLPEHTETEEPP